MPEDTDTSDISEEILDKIYKLNLEYSKYVTHYIGSRSTSSVTSICAAISFLKDSKREHLYLASINATSKGILNLSNALEKNNSLISISFKDVYVGDGGVRAICKALESKKIKSIRLTNAEFGDEAMVFIAEFLQKNHYIRRLILENNRFTQTGLSTFCSALKCNSTLQAFDISKNNIGNEGVASIVEMLSSNDTIESVSIEQANITDEGFIKLAKYFELTNNRTRRLRLYMENNSIDKSGKKALEKATKENKFFGAKMERMEFSLVPMPQSTNKKRGSFVQIKAHTTQINQQFTDTPTITNNNSVPEPEKKVWTQEENTASTSSKANVPAVPTNKNVRKKKEYNYHFRLGIGVFVAAVILRGIVFYYHRRVNLKK